LCQDLWLIFANPVVQAERPFQRKALPRKIVKQLKKCGMFVDFCRDSGGAHWCKVKSEEAVKDSTKREETALSQ